MEKINVKKLAKKQTKSRVTAYAIIVGIALIVYALSMFFVIGWGFINTFKHDLQFRSDKLGLPDFSYFDIPYFVDEIIQGTGRRREIQISGIFANYERVFKTLSYDRNEVYYTGLFTPKKVTAGAKLYGAEAFFIALGNSFLTMFAGTFLPLYLCCIMGYLTVNYKYKFSNFIYALVLFTMIMPIIGAGSSMLNLQRRIGVYDSMIGFFIWNCQFTSMYFLIMFSFFQGLSPTYFEAAEIDGASQIRMIISIAIPMANTMIWAGIVSLVITTWNDYLTPLTYLPSYPTLAYLIWKSTRTGQASQSGPTQIAALYLLALPSLVFFTVFRKKLMGNISIGGIKG